MCVCAALNIKCRKVFVLLISQNVSQPSRIVNLPLMSVSFINREYDDLMVLKIVYVLPRFDTVESSASR